MLNKLIAVIFVITAVTGATYLLVCQKQVICINVTWWNNLICDGLDLFWSRILVF